jgi:hypothetical protein
VKETDTARLEVLAAKFPNPGPQPECHVWHRMLGIRFDKFLARLYKAAGVTVNEDGNCVFKGEPFAVVAFEYGDAAKGVLPLSTAANLEAVLALLQEHRPDERIPVTATRFGLGAEVDA